LTTVLYPGTTVPRQYHYENPNYWSALTGITDERGVRLATYTYYADGKVESATRAPNSFSGGVGRHHFAYGAASTAVTDPLGTQVSYTIAKIAGLLRVTATSGPCQTCGSASAKRTTYTAAGLIDQESDHRDVITDYTVDSRNRETQRIDAAGIYPATDELLPERRSTETDWHPSLNLPTERRTRDGADTLVARTAFAYNGRGETVARCSVDPTIAAASTYICGSLAVAPLGVRQTRTTYCELDPAVNLTLPDPIGSPNENLNRGCPVIGLIRRIDGPRTDVNDRTTYEYRLADHSSCASAPTTCPFRRGDLWKVTNALGHVTEYMIRDGAGRVKRQKDANGTIIDLTYHPRGWLATRTVRANATEDVSSVEDATTQIDYDATGNVIRVTQPDTTFLRYWYDDANRLTSISTSNTAGAGERVVYTLDAAGNRTKEDTFDPSGALKRQLARQYNALSQLRSLVNAPYAGQADLDAEAVKKTTFTYDPNGNQDLSTDPLSTVTDNDYDPLNRLIKTIGDKGVAAGDINATTKYTYDARDNLRTVVDPKNLTTSYTYDGLNNLTQLVSPDTGTTMYGHDAAGNRLSQTDARGVTSSYSYDALNRLTGITYPDAALNVGFAYDQTNAVTGCTSSFPLGRLTRMTDQSGTTTFCYDRRGNVLRKLQVTAGTQFVADMTFTTADRIATITYPDGGRVRYGRDAQGRITTVYWRPAGVGTETTVVSAATWLPFGPLSSLTFGNGRTLAKGYDQNYWIDTVNGTPAGLSLDFTTNDVGNIVGLAVGAAASNRVYGYDDLNRLATVATGTAANVEAFSYDATGNRLSKRVGAAAAVPYAYPTASHRLQSTGGVARSYDGLGNTVTRGASGFPAFRYDARNRLSTVVNSVCASLNPGYCNPPPACDPETRPCLPTEVYLVDETAAAYSYNGRGERVRKWRAGAQDWRFSYDESGRLQGEYSATGAALQQFIWMDDQPVAVIDGGTLRYIESDHLNTPRALIDPARNVAVWRWDLNGSAFGENAANEDPDADGTPVTFNLRFPGQYLDAETGLHYNYFRDYEPGTGRYVESDPIGLDGGTSSYGYANGSALRYLDPTAEAAFVIQAIPPVVKVCVAALGAGIAAISSYFAIEAVKCDAECVLNEEETRQKQCQDLKDSILKTCAGLSGRKKFRCFEAANTSYRQCMGYE
jgi:RHS repeat-associated protein